LPGLPFFTDEFANVCQRLAKQQQKVRNYGQLIFLITQFSDDYYRFLEQSLNSLNKSCPRKSAG